MRKLLKTLLGMTALLAHSVLFAASHNGYTTVDWAVAETFIALGEPPLAVGDMQSYQTWVKQPELPKTTVNLGVRLQPNLELIATLSHSADDLNLVFINSNFYASLNNLLRPYAQVYNVNFYQAGDAWQNVLNATRTIGQIIGKPQAVQQLLAQYEQDVQRLKTELSAFTDRPLAFLQFIDTRHLRIYGENSLFGAVAKQLGFRNAYLSKVNYWGFQNIEITELAKLPPNTHFVIVKPYPANIASALTHNTLWQHLPMTRDALILPAVWSFGAIPSARRFAHVFADGLLHGGDAW